MPKVLPVVTAITFGAVSMVAQTLLLRRFLWRFEAAEAGVALFLSSWLLWFGLGAAAAATRRGQGAARWFSHRLWVLTALCAGLYFVQYALLGNLRGWLGVAHYEQFPVLKLAWGCLLANIPFCFVSGLAVPSVSQRMVRAGRSAAQAYAWDALGSAIGGMGCLALLMCNIAPDPRDVAEWHRYFPGAPAPQRLESSRGTTFHGSHGGTFYALSSSGVSEVIPEKDRSMEQAALILSQRPYARSVLLLGNVPLSVGLALEALNHETKVTWCPCDPSYGNDILRAVRTLHPKTRIRGAWTNAPTGHTPQRMLEQPSDEPYDVVLVMPPSAASLPGAAWRQTGFVKQVRRVTDTSGVMLFGLGIEGQGPTAEARTLLEATVREIRQAWPEGGALAAGAGGWWIAAKGRTLAYGAEDAARRFQMLKKEAVFPAEAVRQLYDAPRAAQWVAQCPALDMEQVIFLPEAKPLEELHALGIADAVRRAYPSATFARWARILEALPRDNARMRVVGLLLVVLCMLPVVAGPRPASRRNLVAVWVAACGALALVTHLTILYRLQLHAGSVYLMAGAAGSFGLAGVFVGNREIECGLLRVYDGKMRLLASALFMIALTVCNLGVCLTAKDGVGAVGAMMLCFFAGVLLGGVLPVALGQSEEVPEENLPVFIFADALGAAVAGLLFIALVPLAGLWQSVMCFAMLALGLGICVVAAGKHIRTAAGVAVLCAMVFLGRQVNRIRRATPEPYPQEVAQGTTPLPREPTRPDPAGIPRRLNMPRVREQMQKGTLSTNAAVFWERL
ncbi:MAG: hypothetical protein FWG50_08010 [Kiritimatiellaeota bacterium]|nr:hypothetical protein [Kiritimatiellota bacterium]